MRLFNINFQKNKKITLEEQNNRKKNDQYVELGKLVKEARTQNNLSVKELSNICLLYTSPSPRDLDLSRMPSSA